MKSAIQEKILYFNRKKNMSAFITVGLTVKDTEKFQQYGASAGETLAEYQGRVVAKGPVEQLHGEFDFAVQVVIEFPSREQASSWFRSEKYQALTSLRNEAFDSQFQLVG